MSEDKVAKVTYPDVPEDINFTTISQAVEVYVATRDQLAAERKAYNSYELRAKAYMERISMYLRDKADEMGVDSFKTQAGTAYRSVKTQYRVGSFDQFVEWMKATENFHCLEKRAAKNAVKEIHEETGEVPPGLEFYSEVEFDVRRPTK